MPLIRSALLACLFALVPLRAALTPDELVTLPLPVIEKVLTKEHPAAFYIYAARLFKEERKDEAVFWLYVGQLRFRFYLMANPKLDPRGDPTLYKTLNDGIGQTITQYAGGDVKKWVAAIDRALRWDADRPNEFTSKTQFANNYQANRSGLIKMRDDLVRR